jgi:beta-lactamase regulating signal transducer with metallopeptidase domain
MNLAPLVPVLAERLGWAVLHSLWQGALAALVLAPTLHLMRRRSAAARHVACIFALFAIVAAVVVTASRSHSAPIASVNLPAPAADQFEGRPTTTPSAATSTTAVSRSQAALSWRQLVPWISHAWMIGVVLLSLRHLAGWRRLDAWRRRAQPAHEEHQQIFARALHAFGITRPVRLLETVDAIPPMLIGFLKPAILLPARLATGLTPVQIEAILAHELAHLARHDAWSNLAQIVIETLFFYHPAVWWIGHCARTEREHAADDLALRVCSDRQQYAGALARLAELELGASLALAATDGHLLARIRRIVAPQRVEPVAGWSVGASLAIVALTTATTFTLRAAPEEPAKTEGTVQEWVADVYQLQDRARREKAIERVREALTSSDPNEVRKGIAVLAKLGPVAFDKESFRPLVRSLLSSTDIPTRAGASLSFPITGADAKDIAALCALADDPAPEVRNNLTAVIANVTNRDLTSPAASEAIVKLMNNLPRDSRSVAHALWGAKFSPQIEARVLEYCRDISGFGVGYNFFYGALSTQANKSEATIKRLIEILADPDTTNKAGRAAWGLQQGVAPEQYSMLATAMLGVLEARSDPYLIKNALSNLRKYATAAETGKIKELLAKPELTQELRAPLEEILTRITAPPATPASASASAAGKEKTTEQELVALREKMAALQSQLDASHAKLTQLAIPTPPPSAPNPLRDENRKKAFARAMQDKERYQPEELSDIESLYQVANKNWRTPEAKESLRKLLDKYDNANRTGCATLYMGQMSEGQERLDYLTRAVEKFSDCYYFDGCQVGGYGRYVLALTLWDKGEKDKARALLADLKTTYKDATDHRGRPMSEIADAAERELAAK